MPKRVIAYDKGLPEIPGRRHTGQGDDHGHALTFLGWFLVCFKASLPILGKLKSLQRCGAKCKCEGRPYGHTHSQQGKEPFPILRGHLGVAGSFSPPP